MKKVFSLALVGSLVFAISTIANAQPPEAPINGLTPQDSISTFLFNCSSGAYTAAAVLVDGADEKAPELATMGKKISAGFGKFHLGATNFTITVDPQNSNFVKADFIVVTRDEMGHGLAQADSANLKKYDDGGYFYWRVIPGNLENYYPSHKINLPPEKCGLTTQLATEIAHPETVLHFDLNESMSQLKQLGLALMQLSVDYENKIQINPQYLKRDLMPYLRTDFGFSAPGDLVGTASYNINPNIVELNIKNIRDPHTLVALYLGKDQKLDFRYDGKSVVCFMDGHVESITPKEAKGLQWKP